MTSLSWRGEQVARWVSPLVLLLLWEAISRSGLINSVFFPAPTMVLAHVPTMFSPAMGFLDNLMTTTSRYLAVILIGTVLGAVTGAVMAIRHSVDRSVGSLLALIFPIPTMLLLPVITFLFGRTDTAIVLTAAISPLVVVAFATAVGVRQIPVSIREAGSLYGCTGMRAYFRLLLPAAVAPTVAGVRLGLRLGLIGVVAMEMVLSRGGVGAVLWASWETLRVRDMYVALAALLLIGVIVTSGFDALARRGFPWLREARV